MVCIALLLLQIPDLDLHVECLPLHEVDETGSEFERSRQASKTWSIEQDEKLGFTPMIAL